ncbi:MAG: DUF3025 domain-containing protein [Comamonadaceae bacterium]|nr:MAG: DUF3025 domain-containing protein [Comamonadaceae bacterium]
MRPSAQQWAQPWFTPYEAAQRALIPHAALPAAQALQKARHPACPQFVPQGSLAADEPYEAHIARTDTVPTRDNLHDFFNGLVWLTFPQAKRQLNALQAGEIARRGIGPTRGPLRDALTLFDENGAVLDAPQALWVALLARDWRALFIDQRALWQEARLLVFGHALMEKLLAGRKDATAHVLLAPGTAHSIPPDDAAIAAALQPAHLAQKPFTPLPIAGVPGWRPENANFCFYDDLQVFRPRRRPEPTTTAKAPARERRTA